MTFFATLCQRAAAANLPFLVIGGNAVVAYGYPRQTVDFDLLVRERDRRQWDEIITSLGYYPHQIARVFHMYAPIDRTLPPIDLMLVDEATFTKLSAQAREHHIAGSAARLPALSHLIALKLHALRSGAPHRYERDMSDVVMLIQLNEVDLATPEYREILVRYATDDTRAKLLRRLAESGPGSGPAGV